jgi:hypothetical protein
MLNKISWLSRETGTANFFISDTECVDVCGSHKIFQRVYYFLFEHEQGSTWLKCAFGNSLNEESYADQTLWMKKKINSIPQDLIEADSQFPEGFRGNAPGFFYKSLFGYGMDLVRQDFRNLPELIFRSRRNNHVAFVVFDLCSERATNDRIEIFIGEVAADDYNRSET